MISRYPTVRHAVPLCLCALAKVEAQPAGTETGKFGFTAPVGASAPSRTVAPALRGTPQVAAESSTNPMSATPLAVLGAAGVCGVLARKQRKGVTARKATITASMETDPAIEEEAGESTPVKKTSVLVLGATGTIGRQVVPLMQIKYLTEQFLKDCGIRHTILRISGLMQPLISQYAVSVLDDQKVWGDDGSAPGVAYIDSQDERTVGQTLTLTGPKVWSTNDVIKLCEELSGRDADVNVVSNQQMQLTMAAAGLVLRIMFNEWHEELGKYEAEPGEVEKEKAGAQWPWNAIDGPGDTTDSLPAGQPEEEEVTVSYQRDVAEKLQQFFEERSEACPQKALEIPLGMS
eukprot:Skav235254  [mRNA]  locus=scaffold3995:367190:375080:+ [translate_table: standard]